jgi:hypothetical protein
MTLAIGASNPLGLTIFQHERGGAPGQETSFDPADLNARFDAQIAQSRHSGSDRFAPKAVVRPKFANLPKQTFRFMVSADLDNVGGHPHHPYHPTSTHPPSRHEHADHQT